MALISMREQNGEQKRKIQELESQVSLLEKEVETVGDQELFSKYKDLVREKGDYSNKLAQAEFNLQSRGKSYSLMENSYQQLKQS